MSTREAARARAHGLLSPFARCTPFQHERQCGQLTAFIIAESESREAAVAAARVAERANGREAVQELWRALRTAVASSPMQYVTRAFVELCGSPDEFVRRVWDARNPAAEALAAIPAAPAREPGK